MAYREQTQSLQSVLYATEKDGSVAIPDLTNSRDEDLYFYYILSNRGEVLARSEAIPQFGDVNLGEIAGWHPREESFRLKWLPELHARPEGMIIRTQDRLLFVGARPVMTVDGRVITIYAAKDVTFYFDVFKTLLIVFFCILVLFIIAALWLSYSMSKRAMIPIQRTYRQQQQFLADASHELRTPLSIMNTSLEVIELENGETLTSFTKEVVSDMKEEVGRMSRMVQHLLLLARTDAGSVEFEKAPFDLTPKLRQWMHAFEAVAQKKAITLKAELPDTMTVTGDVERIKQLVYILLDNAIKYTPEQGTVDALLESSGKQWRLSVRDSGIGIPAADKQRIFDRFYRVEAHRSREEGSAGLGLSIAKWIVEAHQGSIEVDSVVGEGSTFIVKFPL